MTRVGTNEYLDQSTALEAALRSPFLANASPEGAESTCGKNSWSVDNSDNEIYTGKPLIPKISRWARILSRTRLAEDQWDGHITGDMSTLLYAFQPEKDLRQEQLLPPPPQRVDGSVGNPNRLDVFWAMTKNNQQFWIPHGNFETKYEMIKLLLGNPLVDGRVGDNTRHHTDDVWLINLLHCREEWTLWPIEWLDVQSWT